MRHRATELIGDVLDRVAGVPRLALHPPHGLAEAVHHGQRVARVVGVMNQRPAGKAKGLTATLGENVAFIRRSEAEHAHLRVHAQTQRRRFEANDVAIAESCVPVAEPKHVVGTRR